MSSANWNVRPVQDDAEHLEAHRMTIRAFRGEIDDLEAQAQQSATTQNANPELTYERERIVVHDGQIIGGYVMHERDLCIGSARLRTGCIGDVCVLPDYRRQGVAVALMHDALAYAQSKQYALLFLNGIPNFYTQFGYAKTHDMVRYAIACDAVRAMPPSSYQVRSATLDDASTLLDLYHQHFNAYMGRFARGLPEQRYRMAPIQAARDYVLALDADNQARGYIVLGNNPGVSEVAADDWPATLALLQETVRRLDMLDDPPDQLTWMVPPNSPLFYHLSDYFLLEVRMRHLPDGHWMAQPAHLPALLNSLLPIWQERWQQSEQEFVGQVPLSIGDNGYALQFGQDGIELTNAVSGAFNQQIRLSQQALIHLCFGYRPLSWVAQYTDVEIAPSLYPFMDVLFPQSQTWVTGTDFF